MRRKTTEAIICLVPTMRCFLQRTCTGTGHVPLLCEMAKTKLHFHPTGCSEAKAIPENFF